MRVNRLMPSSQTAGRGTHRCPISDDYRPRSLLQLVANIYEDCVADIVHAARLTIPDPRPACDTTLFDSLTYTYLRDCFPHTYCISSFPMSSSMLAHRGCFATLLLQSRLDQSENPPITCRNEPPICRVELDRQLAGSARHAYDTTYP